MKLNIMLVIKARWLLLMGEIKIKSDPMVNYNREIAPLMQEDKKAY